MIVTWPPSIRPTVVAVVSPVSQLYDWNGWHVNAIVTVAITLAVTRTPVTEIVASRANAGWIDGTPPVVSALTVAGIASVSAATAPTRTSRARRPIDEMNMASCLRRTRAAQGRMTVRGVDASTAPTLQETWTGLRLPRAR